MNILYLIPARGGSKGLPGKNIKLLMGKPLIGWSIEAAKNCKHKGKVVVSTDDLEIATVARQFGAEVPFVRPPELANDTTPSVEVVLHAIDYFEKESLVFELIVLLEPTSPLREPKDIDQAIDHLLQVPESESIVGISKTETGHPNFLMCLKNDFIEPYVNKAMVSLRRQDIDDVYYLEGSFYISKVKSFKERRSFYHERALGYVMPKWKSFEVDDKVDFIIIEALLKAKYNNQI